MTPVAFGAAMIAALVVLIAVRLPVALAMGLTGAGGYVALAGWAPLSGYLKTAMVDKFVSYDLAIIPLFILMGQLATRSGVSRSIFDACNAWLGHRRGGLAMASVAGCAAFGAICGSSIATATTMGQVALPEMRRHGTSAALSAGTLAAGGTLGILIPPSIILVIYAVLTEQNIVKLFLAATVPGLLAVLGFMVAIALYVRLFPEEGPAGARLPLRARLRALKRVWHVAAIFVIAIGGIYGGYFTPSEGASVGVVLMAALALALGALTPRAMLAAAVATASASAMIFAILFGADLFNVALALTRIPVLAADWVGASTLAPWLVLAVLIALYLALGCVMDSLSMILLTVPTIFPAFMALDFGLEATHQALWFGVLTLIVVELGMITPPVGLNLFVISSLADGVPTRAVFRGAVPFILSEVVRVALIVAFPALTYWLVDLVAG